MGLCKCQRKKVTNLFCFEHRVNVCEYCLVSDHPKCIVQSYLQWLQDSDYNPVCGLCNNRLDNDKYGDCVRLLCYDVFHWPCLNRMASELPRTTAPAGFECPTCRKEIIPRPNQAGPAAEALKSRLSSADWALPGLGLPSLNGVTADLVDSTSTPIPPALTATPRVGSAGVAGAAANDTHHHHQNSHPHHSAVSLPDLPETSFSSGPRKLYDSGAGVSSTQQNVGGQSPVPGSYVCPAAGSLGGGLPHGVGVVSANSPLVGAGASRLHYEEEDKYRRRPAFSWLSRWIKAQLPSSVGGSGHSRPNKRQRLVVLGLICFIGFCTLMLFMARVGRWSAEGDPMLDPRHNPNIRVEHRAQGEAAVVNRLDIKPGLGAGDVLIAQPQQPGQLK